VIPFLSTLDERDLLLLETEPPKAFGNFPFLLMGDLLDFAELPFMFRVVVLPIGGDGTYLDPSKPNGYSVTSQVFRR